MTAVFFSGGCRTVGGWSVKWTPLTGPRTIASTFMLHLHPLPSESFRDNNLLLRNSDGGGLCCRQCEPSLIAD
ncbi:unnamed protein product [Gadus morhua 'NCC']